MHRGPLPRRKTGRVTWTRGHIYDVPVHTLRRRLCRGLVRTEDCSVETQQGTGTHTRPVPLNDNYLFYVVFTVYSEGSGPMFVTLKTERVRERLRRVYQRDYFVETTTLEWIPFRVHRFLTRRIKLLGVFVKTLTSVLIRTFSYEGVNSEVCSDVGVECKTNVGTLSGTRFHVRLRTGCLYHSNTYTQ